MIKATKELASKLGITFNQPQLLDVALTHRSAGRANGERLEFLGDAVLGLVVADKIFSNCRTASEGQMSRLRATLVCKSTLAEIAQQWKVGDYLVLGSGELKSGGFRRSSILADAIEAIIGAYYKDQGYVAANALVETLFGERLTQLHELDVTKDAKSRLQEYLQAKALQLPIYKVNLEEGPPHARHFKVSCHVTGLNMISEGEGASRRVAEQNAASAMLGMMNYE